MIFNSTDKFIIGGVEVDKAIIGGVTVYQAVLPTPIFLMTEPLIATGTFDTSGDEYYALTDSSGGGYHGILVHTGDGSKAQGRAVVPSLDIYSQNGTIDMSIQGDGFGSIEARTNWIEPQDEVSVRDFIYDADMVSAYKIVRRHYYGSTTKLCDVWRGDQDTPISLAVADTGLLYTPSLTQEIFGENLAKEIIPTIPTCVITMSDYTLTVGETATVTFTFNTIPLGFGTGNITSPNGVISSLTQTSDEWIYTATFTPTAETSDATNVITVLGALGEFTDQWLNSSDANFTSSNYTVETVTEIDVVTSIDGTINSGDGSFNYSVVDRAFDISTIAVTTNTFRPSQVINISGAINAQNYEIRFDHTSSDNGKISAIAWSGGAIDSIALWLNATTDSIVIPTTCDVTSPASLVIYYDGTSSFNHSITNFKIVEVP